MLTPAAGGCNGLFAGPRSEQSLNRELYDCLFASLEPALIWTDNEQAILVSDLASVPVAQRDRP